MPLKGMIWYTRNTIILSDLQTDQTRV